MKIRNIQYEPVSQFLLAEKLHDITRYLMVASEFGEKSEGKRIFDRFQDAMDMTIAEFQKLVLAAKDADEPDDFKAIQTLRPEGPRRLCTSIGSDYGERIRGAFYGRMAGCTLGAMLEFQSVDCMKHWAEHFGDVWPPVDYWRHPMQDPLAHHYIVGKKLDLTRSHMDAVPPDDDTVYTLMGLLILEKFGMDFTKEDFAQAYLRYLPMGSDNAQLGDRGCWWGERHMMRNLKQGMTIDEAGITRNPNLQNIAAWTRADSYGYACPGWPEKAAELAYKDSATNHRRNGIYGSMFMAATIAAAFVVDSAEEAVRIGLSEIPKDCLFAEGVRWALEQKFSNYREAYDLVWARYKGMFNGSALTNALHVVMGLMIGQRDFTRVIGETIAMSGDNDCTGATSGSIVGAIIGKKQIPANWTDPFNGRMHIYLNEHDEYLSIEEVCSRFEALAKKFASA
jgi:ADP-ribosylglycohydrolase